MTPEAALAEHMKFLQGFKPSKMPTYPNHKNARAFIADLEAFARSVDAVVKAYGEEIQYSFDITDEKVLTHFTNTLTDALDGYALYAIDEAGRKKEEAEREFKADPRGWNKARDLGVD